MHGFHPSPQILCSTPNNTLLCEICSIFHTCVCVFDLVYVCMCCVGARCDTLKDRCNFAVGIQYNSNKTKNISYSFTFFFSSHISIHLTKPIRIHHMHVIIVLNTLERQTNYIESTNIHGFS